ncbi:MAG: cation-transporting P-type ATPase, partial [Campylobacterota bacterium]|nr:cation-transporting P-type ATPase [Campylobacterota bacterium]
IQGLNSDEALKRLEQYGLNEMPPPKRKSLLERFLLQFHNILIYVLLAASLVTALLGHWIDTSVILGVVIINAIIGVVQEGKAEKALDAIRKMLSHQSMVRRDGKLLNTPATQLVPGDIVSLQSGDKVPADLRLIQLKELRIDEALLTGESLPADKNIAHLPQKTSIADRRCMAYSGTLVTYGTGIGIVVATAEETQIGNINSMLRDVETLTTPLLRQIDGFARLLTLGIVMFASIAFGIGFLIHNYTAVEMFMAAVGLAVAAIPEGLPAIMTIALAIGVQKMAGRNAIIRRLPAVETLGSVTTICSDKTGTLTCNEMTVRTIISARSTYEVSGSGYDPHGEVSHHGSQINPEDDALLTKLAHASILCNDASLSNKDNKWMIQGDPTEAALVVFGMKCALEPHLEQTRALRTDVIPFESQHSFMATLHHNHEKEAIVYIKGSPEQILSRCHSQDLGAQQEALNPSYWHAQMDKIAQKGQRLLAIAYKPMPSDTLELSFSDVEHELVLLGIIGMIDPPREEAIAAVTACHQAGIRVKMITGDHLLTATSIGKLLGIGNGSKTLSGGELSTISDAKLREIIDDIDIFARTTPEQKLRLVTALQANGHVVAMTGDGVNDAPALKRADVGIAMGEKGTEVSKEAAEIVLSDDNFASITHAVEEGRTVYDNLKKSILFILPTNGGEALIILAAIVMGRMLPITPVQILWVNMITAVTLALTLAFESAEKDIMKRPPRESAEPLLSKMLIWRISFVSIILMLGTFGLFVWFRNTGSSIEEARTIAVNTLVFFEIFYLFNARHFTASAFNKETLLGNPYAIYATGLLIIFQLLFTYAPPMQKLFQTSALSLGHWLIIIAVASSVFFLVEAEKWVLRKKRVH